MTATSFNFERKYPGGLTTTKFPERHLVYRNSGEMFTRPMVNSMPPPMTAPMVEPLFSSKGLPTEPWRSGTSSRSHPYRQSTGLLMLQYGLGKCRRQDTVGLPELATCTSTAPGT